MTTATGYLREDLAVTDEPVELDARRTAAGKIEIELRRHSANNGSSPKTVGQPHLESLEQQMMAEPVPTWIETMERCRLLLDRYAASPDGQAPRTRELIERALDEIAHLIKHQEQEP